MEAGPTPLEEFAADARERFERIEARLVRVEARLDLSATKVDLADLRAQLHQEFFSLIKWMVGTAVVLGASAITVITFVLNYATPPRIQPVPQAQISTSTQPPVIIQLPPYPAPRP